VPLSKPGLGGDLVKIDTRIPPGDMERVDFGSVASSPLVPLLLSTPTLCPPRVRGPVTDVALQLEHEFGSRVTFIHNKVYVDDNSSKGLRPNCSRSSWRPSGGCSPSTDTA
jgi:hypothetical protein